VSPYAEIPCTGTGQDGAYNINPMSFTDNGNGTVTDNNTELIWQKYENASTYNWYQASGTYDATYNPSSQNICGSLNLGGSSDWRLPTKKELITIVDYSIPYPGPTINMTYFPNTNASDYWSSTTTPANPNTALYVLFSLGYFGANDKYNSMYVRCARGGQYPPQSLVDNSNGTVTDNATGLMWQQEEPGPMLWDSALSYCEGLSLGGHTDWRLPNTKELESLTDDTKYPSIDTAFFPNAYNSIYCSSTTLAGYPNNAWYVIFSHGQDVYDYKYSSWYVRCVRGGQSGSLGNLDHFEFSVIPSPQSVGTPFSITISAKDFYGNVVNFSGSVSVWSNAGAVSPVSIYLTSGSWTGNVTLYEAGCGVHLGASGGGKSGVSNNFAVSGSGASTGSLQGVVKDENGNMINGASLCLLADKVGSCVSTTTTTNGFYQFNNIGCCQYYVYAEQNSVKSYTHEITVPCGRTVTEDLIISSCNPDGRTPVLLVPGIMGSTSKKIHSVPVLPPYSPDWDSESLEIYDTNITDHAWANLKTSLRNAGYSGNCTIFDVPYDWRINVADAAKEYLKKWIDKAKSKAGTANVNIVAHSMGGLVTRAYIQSNDYDNDIEKFAMVGTPNHGSANAFYLWQGGDPLTADFASTSDWSSFKPSYSFLTAINYLSTGHFSTQIKDYLIYYDFIHDHILSVKQLMPTYSFLIPYNSLHCEKNEWLDTLNNNSNISRLAKIDDPDSSKVKTKLFIGNNTDTITNIWAGLQQCSRDLYPDGIPLGVGPLALQKDLVQMQPYGDGTVLASSSMLGNGVSYGTMQTGNHVTLINTFKDDIVSFMTSGIAVASTPSLDYLGEEALLPSSTLSIMLSGRVQPYVVSPAAQESGIKNNVRVNNIPNTTVSIGAGASSINIENPVNGTYTLYLKGVYSEDYGLAIGYSDSSSNVLKAYQGFNQANTTSFTFTVNSGSVDKITMNYTPLPPTDLQADAINSGGLKTRLTWDLSSDPNVVHYNIYSKYLDEPYLTQIATTTGNLYDTGHLWATNSTIKTRVYAVSAVNSGGKESFLSDMVQNDDRDHDGLSDEKETSLGTNVSNPDTDGDGLKDGEEYVRGTNPLVIDTDGDGYSDYVEVKAGSDPLDVNSKPNFTWVPIPGLTASSPALAWSPSANKLQMVVRASNDTLWASTFNSSVVFNNNWVNIPGLTASAPALAWNPVTNKMQMVVRASNNTLWASTFSSSGTFNNDWINIPGLTPDAPALAWNPLANEMQMAVKGSDGSSIWAATFNSSGVFNNDWVHISGAMVSSPALAWNEGASEMQLVVRASNSTIWASTFSSSGVFNNDWVNVPGLTASSPALAWSDFTSSMHMMVRASNDTIWASTFNSSGNFNNDWLNIPGLTASSPGMAYLPSIGYLGIVVRASDDSLWEMLY
jgi:pimeloyl-ACP methyl ester carboxylesterase